MTTATMTTVSVPVATSLRKMVRQALVVALLAVAAAKVTLLQPKSSHSGRGVWVDEVQKTTKRETDTSQFNKCQQIADELKTNPDKPCFEVCGSDMQVTVHTHNACIDYMQDIVIGHCDPTLPQGTCETKCPSEFPTMGKAQSYMIQACENREGDGDTSFSGEGNLK